jgi:hypothetical protein
MNNDKWKYGTIEFGIMNDGKGTSLKTCASA